MHIVIFGATGMVGHGVLLEALDAPDVERVTIVGRRQHEVEHAKLNQVLHDDFTDLSAIEEVFKGADGCFYCIGVSSAGMSEERYREITCDFTAAAVDAFARVAPEVAFCFVSGAGTDLHGGAMWARAKADAEEYVKAHLQGAYCFRPAYIQPLRGVTSQVGSYRVMYAVLGPFYGVWKKLPKYVTSTVEVGNAMLHIVRERPPATTLENADIVALGRAQA